MNREDVTMRRARKTVETFGRTFGIALAVLALGTMAVRGDEPANQAAAQNDATQNKAGQSNVEQNKAVQAAVQLNPPGPEAVEVVPEVVLHDKKREKDLPIFVSYPKGEGPFPVIIFSHGAGGAGKTYEALLKYWSSHGYVCLAPTHAESLSLRNNRNGEQQQVAGANDNNTNDVAKAGGFRGVAGAALRDPKAGENRAADISFLIDSLDDLAAQTPALAGKMDAKRLGVGGHSLGAYTAQLIGGAVVEGAEGKPQTFVDDRAIAILQLSGQGAGQQGLTEHSWDKFNKPMMTMTGSRDRGAQGQGPDWKKEAYQRAPAGDKYHVYIEGANHFSFTGRLAGAEGNRRIMNNNAGGADQAVVFSYIENATQAFWDAYLKGDEKAKEYLKSEKLKDASGGAVSVERK